jgi:hypothetical protein
MRYYQSLSEIGKNLSMGIEPWYYPQNPSPLVGAWNPHEQIIKTRLTFF